MPVALARALGIAFDRKHPQRSTGASGPFREFATQRSFQLLTNVGELTLHGPLLNDRMPPDQVVLGRSDVFAAFRITFDEIRNQMIIEPRTKGRPRRVERTRTRSR